MLLARLSFLAGLFVCAFLVGLPAVGQEKKTNPALPVVRGVDLRENRIPLSKALAEVKRQTGITVADDRGEPDRTLSLDIRQAPFWQAVDAIATAANARAVLTDRDGSVRLVALRRGDRVAPTSYDGDFRVRASQILASRQLDSDRSGCTVSLEIVWTPTLKPLFLESQVREIRLLDADGKAVAAREEGSSLTPVDGRFSFTIDLALPGFPRANRHIGELSGKLFAVAPSSMLTFRFDAGLKALNDAVVDGEVRRLRLEDVVCRLSNIKLERGRWTVSVALEYPDDSLRLESFQSASLVVHNELTLVSKDGKRSLSPGGYVIEHVTSRRALVSYHFSDRPGAPRGRVDDWQVQYKAPARIVSVPFRFTFRNLPLP